MPAFKAIDRLEAVFGVTSTKENPSFLSLPEVLHPFVQVINQQASCVTQERVQTAKLRPVDVEKGKAFAVLDASAGVASRTAQEEEQAKEQEDYEKDNEDDDDTDDESATSSDSDSDPQNIETETVTDFQFTIDIV